MKKRLKIIFGILSLIILSVYFFSISYGDENNCTYQKKIDDCINLKDKRTMTGCISGTREEITYQIILDEEFSKVDEEIEKYLDNLEKDKDKYFGPNKEATYVEAINYITENFNLGGDYYAKYYDICKVSGIIGKAEACIGGKTNIDVSKHFFDNSTCIDLVETKLDLYEQVAYDILMLNKGQVRKDSQKLFEQQQRTKYDSLIDKMKYNENYMENISNKWSGKIKKAY